MARKKKQESTMHWCYIGDNKDTVLMMCSKEEWDAIWDVIEWAKYVHSKEYMMRHESDIVNYSYTSENR